MIIPRVMAGLEEQQRRLNAQFQGFGALGSVAPVINLGPPIWISDLNRRVHEIAGSWQSFMRTYEQSFAPFQATMAKLVIVRVRRSKLKNAGWLPHYTTPYDLVDEFGPDDADSLSRAIQGHYEDRWVNVRAAFDERLSGCDLDGDAKDALAQTLDAHGHGLFRCTARTLFPEIERLTRMEFHQGAPRSFASQKELREAALDLDLHDIEPSGLYGLTLFDRLLDHVYAQADTPAAISAFAADPVPNRHAALHGLVPYNSHQSSLNTLIMADFAYQVVCAVKGQVERARIVDEGNKLDGQ